MKLSDWIKNGIVRIGKKTDADQQVMLIAQHVMKITREQLMMIWTEELSPLRIRELDRALVHRIQGMPLQYLLGEEYFFKLPLSVGYGVLIPRPETEILVRVVADRVKEPKLKVAELGPGSGNIGITLLKIHADWEWHGMEKNHESIPYLKANVAKYLPNNPNFHIHEGDFFAMIGAEKAWDMIVSNPPYIKTAEIPTLAPEVQFEPKLALDGGEDGLRVIEQLVKTAVQVLKSEGRIAFEIGHDQGDAAVNLVKPYFKDVERFKDQAGHHRVIFAKNLKS